MKIFALKNSKIGADWISAPNKKNAEALAAQIASDKNKPVPAVTGEFWGSSALSEDDCRRFYIRTTTGYTPVYLVDYQRENHSLYWNIEAGSPSSVGAIRTTDAMRDTALLERIARAIYGQDARIANAQTAPPTGTIINYAALSVALS